MAESNEGAPPRATGSREVPPPGFEQTQPATPDTPEVFESPVERRLVLERLNAKLFGDGNERVAPTIGRFSVLRKLGQGGMGTVYLGYDEKLGRKAAIKLLRNHHGTQQGRDRMAREAKALARLSHPNVVPIYESGEHEDDLFIAMEFVDGQTLGEWLNERKRSQSEILEVFIAAARGLAAAHEAKLVHRDFKPDNVMIGEEGQVKVMDFGLARRAERSAIRSEHDRFSVNWDPASWTARSLTQTGALMGTPAYMAPEQLVGEATDARSDQFSFCVALWEALYGQRPFTGDTIGSLRASVLSGRVLEPPRGAEVPSWLRALLDRGLALDVEARWPSMKVLIDALDSGAPRRARVVLAICAGLLVSAALIAGLTLGLERWRGAAPTCTGMDSGLVEAWNDEHRAALSQAIMGTGLSYASETRERVEAGLDSYGERWVAARREACEATARGAQSGELLDRRMACLDTQLREFAGLVGVLERADTRSVEKAVNAIAELPRPERCADAELLADAYAPPEDPEDQRELARVEEDLALARSQYRAGNYADAAALLDELWPATEALAHVPVQIDTALMRGDVAKAEARYEDAETCYVQAYRLALAVGLTDAAAKAAIDLVGLFGTLEGKHEQASAWVVHAEPLATAADSSEVLSSFAGAVGLAASNEGRYADAFTHHQRQLQLLEHAAPSPLTLTNVYTNLGIASAKQSKLEQARAYFERTLELGEGELGPSHPRVAAWLDNLGNVLRQLGEYDQAIARYERALAIREAALGPHHPEVANTLTNLGLGLTAANHFEAARPLQERARDIYIDEFGPAHPRVAIALSNLGLTLSNLDEHEQALAVLEQALAIKREVYGDEHPSVLYTLNGLGASQLKLGRLDDAHASFSGALALAEVKLGGEHLLLVPLISGLGTVARHRDELELAFDHYTRALALAERLVGPQHPQSASLSMNIGGVLMLQGHAAEALEHFQLALAVREAGLAPTDGALLEVRVFVAAAQIRLARAAEARVELEGVRAALSTKTDDSLSPLLRAKLLYTASAAASALDDAASVNTLAPELAAARAELEDQQGMDFSAYMRWFE